MVKSPAERNSVQSALNAASVAAPAVGCPGPLGGVPGLQTVSAPCRVGAVGTPLLVLRLLTATVKQPAPAPTVRHALGALDFAGAEKVVRINASPWALQDLGMPPTVCVLTGE